MRPDCTIVTLTRYPEIFEKFAVSVEHWEPLRRRIVVTSGGCRIERLGWEVIQGVEPFNFARNLNLAIARIEAGDVLVSNDDVVLKQPLIAELQSTSERDQLAGIISPQIMGGVGNPAVRFTGSTEGSHHLTREPIPFVCVLLRSPMLRALGPLDESFTGYGGEDEDYNWRALDAGWRLAISKATMVKHGFGNVRASSSFLRTMTEAEREASMRRNRAAARAKHGRQA